MGLDFDMERPEAPKLLRQWTIDAAGIRADRLTYDGRALDCDPIGLREDAFQIAIYLTDCLLAQTWRNDRLFHEASLPKGSVRILDMRHRWRSRHLSSFAMVRYHIPIARLRSFADMAGRPELGTLSETISERDDIAFGLAQALLPAFDDPHATHPLFLDHINLALLTHVTQAYGGVHFPASRKGTLAPWQERRATDFLSAHMDGQFSIPALAQECGLSRSHFAKAFKNTFGKTPLRWLAQYRVAKASDLLLSGMSIAEVAVMCGFADQSHLTRAFTEILGEPPGNWRRQRLPQDVL